MAIDDEEVVLLGEFLDTAEKRSGFCTGFGYAVMKIASRRVTRSSLLALGECSEMRQVQGLILAYLRRYRRPRG